MSLFGHPSKRKVQTLAHLHPNHLKNPLVQHQLHNEGADEADHAGPGVPNLRGLGEPQEGLAQLRLHPGRFNPWRKFRSTRSQSSGSWSWRRWQAWSESLAVFIAAEGSMYRQGWRGKATPCCHCWRSLFAAGEVLGSRHLAAVAYPTASQTERYRERERASTLFHLPHTSPLGSLTARATNSASEL